MQEKENRTQLRRGGSLLARVLLSLYAVCVSAIFAFTRLAQCCHSLVLIYMWGPHSVKDLSFDTPDYLCLLSITQHSYVRAYDFLERIQVFGTRARMYLEKPRQMSALLYYRSLNLEWNYGTHTNGGGG